MQKLQSVIHGKNPNKVLVLHGFGANMHDLEPLRHEIPALRGLEWHFINAPYGVDIGMGMQGRAWFPLPASYFLAAGHAEDAALDYHPAELDGSTEQILNYLAERQFSPQHTYFIGFSQGAMTALHLAIQAHFAPKAIGVFSGAFICRQNWNAMLQNHPLQNTAVFQSHGSYDPVLPFSWAEKLSAFIQQKINPKAYKWHAFPGEHTISADALLEFSTFIDQLQTPETKS